MIKKGSVRIVLCFCGWAVKIPRFDHYENFLHGILANLQENKFSKMKNKMLAPVIITGPFGIFIIMRKARILTKEDFSKFKSRIIFNARHSGLYDLIMSDFKAANFGIINNKIVKVDYGD